MGRNGSCPVELGYQGKGGGEKSQKLRHARKFILEYSNICWSVSCPATYRIEGLTRELHFWHKTFGVEVRGRKLVGNPHRSKESKEKNPIPVVQTEKEFEIGQTIYGHGMAKPTIMEYQCLCMVNEIRTDGLESLVFNPVKDHKSYYKQRVREWHNYLMRARRLEDLISNNKDTPWRDAQQWPILAV